MRKNLKKIIVAAGLSLALAFTISSCSKDDAAELVCLQQGLSYDSDLGMCVGAAENGRCPAGSSLSEDGNLCTADAVEGGNASDGEWSMWWTFTDINDGGSSTINSSENNGAVTVSGNISGNWGAGWGTSDEALVAKAKTAKSVSFNVKGDGKTYIIRFNTSDITDYDSYSASFATTTGSKKVTLCLADFAQEGWGALGPMPFTQSKITEIIFAAHSNNISGKFGPVTISDLSFGTAACTSSEPATTKQYADYGPKWIMPNGSEGGGCYEADAAGKALCESEDWCRVVSACPQSSLVFASSYCTWDDGDGGCSPIGGFNMPTNANCTNNYGTVRSGSCAGTIVASPTNPPTTGNKLYCQWSGPTTGFPDANCYEIQANSEGWQECNDSEYAQIVSACGTANFKYCDYGPVNADGGGCHFGACPEQWGTTVSKCPASSL